MSENMQLVSLSRQIALQRQMDVVANNMANINTTGFKAEDVLFEEYVMPVARDRDFPTNDQPLSYTQDWATVHDMSPGAMIQTGNPLDVALQGPGFLVVETPAGERFSRSGAMVINAQGTLTDMNGNPVLGDGGPIQFDSTDNDISIAADGSVLTSNGSKGRLRVVEFADPQTATREGDNLWAGADPVAAINTRIIGGAIERSNVSGVTEMAQMIRVSRAYQSLASIMQRQDELRSNAIRRLGDMSA